MPSPFLTIPVAEYTTTRLLYVLLCAAVFSYCLLYIFKNGTDFVQYPKLNPSLHRKRAIDLAKAKKSLKVS